TSATSAATAASSSVPSAEMVIVEPRAAASSRMPMMLLPSISRRSRATRTLDSYFVARCTNFAAARACMPSWLTTVTAWEVIERSSRRALLAPEQIRGDPDRAPPVIAHLLRDGEQIGRPAQARELDQHRQVHAGDHLELVLLEKRH